MYKNVHSNFVHNSPNLETTEKPINSRMGELWYITRQNIIQVIRKNKHSNTIFSNESQGYNFEWKKSRYKKLHTLGFHLCKIQKRAKLSSVVNKVLLGVRTGQGSPAVWCWKYFVLTHMVVTPVYTHCKFTVYEVIPHPQKDSKEKNPAVPLLPLALSTCGLKALKDWPRPQSQS